jgi:hypothetical protein
VQFIDGPSSTSRIAVSKDEWVSNWLHVQLHVSVADAHKDRVIRSLTLRGITFSAEARRYSCKSQVVICTQTCHLCTTDNTIPRENSPCQMAVYYSGRPSNRKFFRSRSGKTLTDESGVITTDWIVPAVGLGCCFRAGDSKTVKPRML